MMRKNWLLIGSIALFALLLVGGLAAPSLIHAQDDAQAYLGVRYRQTDAGAVVVMVVPGSPADDADLQRGDVITAVNGESVVEEGALTTIVAALAPGDEITMAVTRDGEALDLTVVLGDTADALALQRGDWGGMMGDMSMMPFFDEDFNLDDYPLLGDFIVENEDGSYTITMPNMEGAITITPNDDGGYSIEVPPGFEGMMPFGGSHMQPGDGRLWIFPDGGMDRDHNGRGGRGNRGGGRDGMFRDDNGMFMLPWLEQFGMTVDPEAGTMELLLPDMEAPIVIPMGAMMDPDFDWDAFLSENPDLADLLPEGFDLGDWFGSHGGMFGFRFDLPDVEETEPADDASTSA